MGKRIICAVTMLVLFSFALALACTQPPAEFKASVTSGQAPLTISFTNLAETYLGAKADEFQWDFGDGATITTSTTEEPVTHEYTKAGSYTVSMTAVKKGAPPGTTTKTITVTVKPGPLDRVKLSPQTVELEISQSQEFTAEAVDAYDNPIPEAKLTWETAEGVGAIDSGVLRAGTKAGTFDEGIVITAELDTHSAKATAWVMVYILAEVTDLVGDKDGFGLGFIEGDEKATVFGPLVPMDNREPDDPPFTDVWPTILPSDARAFSYDHTYDLTYETIVSAELSFFTLGVKDGDTQVAGSDTDIKLFLDGVEVDGAFDDLDQFRRSRSGSQWVSTAGPYSISIPGSVLSVLSDGNVEVRIDILQLGTSPGFNAIAIDFSELTIVVRTPPPVLAPAPALLPPPVPPETVVTFPDENLEAAISKYLAKPPGGVITEGELAGIRSLYADEMGIADLTGIEYLVDLAMLGLRSNQISDISPLVENSGLGEGDRVWLQDNNLDLSEGSEDLENIRKLEERGVVVIHTASPPPAPAPAPTKIAPEVGALAPDFTLSTLNGSTVALSNFRGKPVLLNFWTSWCGPCRSEMPYLQEVFEEMAREGLVVLTINLREDDATVRQFMQEKGYTFVVGLDLDGAVSSGYQVRSIPTTFFIDRAGVIHFIHIGAFKDTTQILTLLTRIMEPVPAPAPAPAPKPTPAPVPEIPQTFETYLPPGAVVGATFSISKVLEVGEEVNGFIEISDTESHSTDYSRYFFFEVLNPEEKTIYSWEGNYRSDNNHEFSFDVSDTGKYIIKITHHSNYRKALYVKILPLGWTSEK